MKKIIPTLLMAAAMCCMLSCKKDDPAENGNDTGNGTLSEGIYQPKYKIASICLDNRLEEDWVWAETRLDHVTDYSTEAPATHTFSYSGNLLSKVVSAYTDGSTSESRFTYTDGQATGYALVENGKTVVSAVIDHNASGKLFGATLTIDQQFLVEMGQGLFNFKSPLAKVIGRDATKQLCYMAQQCASNAKMMTFSTITADIKYTWSGNNIATQTLSLDVTGNASIADIVDLVGSDALGSLSSYISLLGSDPYPLEMSYKSVSSYTYDNNVNPLYYYWGEGPTDASLSQNNILTCDVNNTMGIDYTVVLPESIPFLGGQTFPIQREFPSTQNYKYTYQYNDKKCPTTVTDNNGSVTTYNYK